MQTSSSPDVVIINPGSDGVYGDIPNELVAVEPPLWCRLIAGYVQDAGFRVRIIDAEACRMSPADVAMEVAIMGPKVACIAAYGHQPSASTQSMPGAFAIARAIKAHPEMYPPPSIGIVGGHVSALPGETLEECGSLDWAAVGEGPVTVVELLRKYPRGQVQGLAWRESGLVMVNKPAPLIPIDLLHGDVWNMLPMHRYRPHNWQTFGWGGAGFPSCGTYASIYTSLGCPYRCNFCCINAPFAQPGAKGNAYRMRAPADVVAEIVTLATRYGVRTFKITDEMFVLKESHYLAIAEGLVHSGIGDKINIWAYARIDTVKPATLALLRAAGIRWLALGIESGSAHVRDGADKALKPTDIMATVRAIQDAGINVIANYIFGLPDDDMASMQDTLRLALDLNTEFANFYVAMAYPGSALYRRATTEGGWDLPTSWIGYSQHAYECQPLGTGKVSAREVLKFRDMAFQFYFTCIPYLEMIERKFGADTRSRIVDMTHHKLRRKLLDPQPAAA